MEVKLTADQFYELTRVRLDQLHWPENDGRAITEVLMTIGQLQILVAALWDNEATREVETIPELDQEDWVDIEATREGENVPKLDQVDIDAT